MSFFIRKALLGGPGGRFAKMITDNPVRASFLALLNLGFLGWEFRDQVFLFEMPRDLLFWMGAGAGIYVLLRILITAAVRRGRVHSLADVWRKDVSRGRLASMLYVFDLFLLVFGTISLLAILLSGDWYVLSGMVSDAWGFLVRAFVMLGGSDTISVYDYSGGSGEVPAIF